MTNTNNENGFSAVEIVIVIAVIALLAVGGWVLSNKIQNSKPDKHTNSSSQVDDKRDTIEEQKLPDGWTKYENAEIGITFAHPESWEITEPEVIATATGEEGLTVAVRPKVSKDGDPSFNLATYPSNAQIKDVDAYANDIKLQDVTTADGMKLSLIGMIGNVDGATTINETYLTSCWPRNCSPTLKNGRRLSVSGSVYKSDCVGVRAYCPSELNRSSEAYQQLVGILESISAL